MADPLEGPIVVETDSPTATPRRTTRPTKHSGRVQDTLRSLENAAVKPVGKSASRAARGPPAEVDADVAGDGKRARGTGETGKVMPQKVLELLGKVSGEVGEKGKICEHSDTILNQVERISKQEDLIRELQAQLTEPKEDFRRQTKESRDEFHNTKEEPKQVREQLEAIKTTATSVQRSPQASYADIARTPPLSPPTNIQSLSSTHTTPSSFTDTLYRTIDTSRVEEQDRNKSEVGGVRQAIEGEMRAREGHERWRCAAVVKYAKNSNRIKVIRRDEGEPQPVKEAAEKTAVSGGRIPKDQLYPVKVDNANRMAVLDSEGTILPGAPEALGAENKVSIAKISRLSKKESGKPYGSMVVYVTKGSDAKRLLDGHYFDLAGESAYTNVFEPRLGPVQCFKCQEIGHKSFSCKKPQLNVRKQEPVQLSVMNDPDLEDYAVVAVSEPYARKIDGKVITSPAGHSNWTKIIPTHATDTKWPIRSMLWVRRDIEADQIPVPSGDLTAAVLRLAERDIMVVSVYVEGRDEEALASATGQLHGLIQKFRNGTGRRTDVVLAGDFNRHDHLWGGDDVSAKRQGEAEPVIELMNQHGLCRLLPRGTKTWQGRDAESTIDLVLATSELAEEVVECGIHPTEHGSDHRAIRTAFDVATPERTVTHRLMLKNAPWILISARVEGNLRPLPWTVDVQTQTDQLMQVVLEAIHDLTPRAPPPPYAKRWWTKDLTRLRRAYTFWRNQARTQRRAGQLRPDLEARAKGASKEYHDGIRKQKRAHWDEFLAEDANIWKAARYLQPGKDNMEDKVPPLAREDGSKTGDRAEQAEELLQTFFPPLPARIEAESRRPHREALSMPDLTLEEIEEKVMVAKPWKAPGDDCLPAVGVETPLARGEVSSLDSF